MLFYSNPLASDLSSIRGFHAGSPDLNLVIFHMHQLKGIPWLPTLDNIIFFFLCNQVLLINFPSLGTMSAGENFKFIFREAKINDAILFFDECESIFESREHGGRQVNLLLTEIERYTQVC